jgi:hypothetical protein
MIQFFESLKAHIEQHPPNYGDGESVLTMLYECHNENNPYDNEQIKEDFNELYRQMNGMSLQEMDKIIYPVCKLCRDHEKAGIRDESYIGYRFVEGNLLLTNSVIRKQSDCRIGFFDQWKKCLYS